MRPMIRLAIPSALLALAIGCDSAMTDVTPKPEVTGEGPKEPTAPGKNPGSGKVDMGEVGSGGPLETKVQKRPAGAPRPVASPDGKAH